MRLTTFLAIKAIISLVCGIALVLAPTTLMSLYGVTLDPAGILVSRLIGAILVGMGLVCFLAGRTAARKALRRITLGLFITDTIGFIAALLVQLDGTANALGWLNVAIWLLSAWALGYFRFVRPRARARRQVLSLFHQHEQVINDQ